MATRRRKRTRTFRLDLQMKKRLFAVMLLVAAFLVGLIGRIAFIQAKSGSRYEKIVLNQQQNANTVIPFRRGDITDRKGTVLATSTDVYNVILDCSVITSKKEYLKPTVQALHSCFGTDVSQITAYINSHKKNKYYVLIKKVSSSSVDRFEKLQTVKDKQGKEQKTNVRGVWFEREYVRKYPYKDLGSAMIGFTASGNVGIGGLEDYYNEELNGVNGRAYGYMNADKSYEQTVKDASDGNTIVSTIDMNIQSIAERKVKDWAANHASSSANKDGAKNIGVIIMDPNSGEVLAMVSYPTFDLNHPWNLKGFYSEDAIAKMSQQQRLKRLNRIWQNFCVNATYEPGSTAKPFTVAAGLDSGKMTGNEVYYCGGSLKVNGQVIHCDKHSGHGAETVNAALRDSCNVSLMQMGFQIGAATFSKYQQIFNFGLKTNIDLPGESRTSSLIYSRQALKTKVNLATNAFGQNFNVTMIQMISGYCSLVNGGKYYQPHMVKAIQDENGNTIRTIDPVLLRRTISESTSNRLRPGLQAVTNSGTGNYAKLKGYSMCGKTGTAEKQPRGNGKYVVSFEGSVPAKNPKVAIYCVVDEPNTADQAHSKYAQQIVKSILKEVLPYMNIEKDEK